jgi:L-asparaginase
LNLRRGPISAGFLDPLKARIVLRQLLIAGHDLPAVRVMFARAGGCAESDEQSRNSGARAVARA